jgi:pimeloyl-ACP methyl ester carboxylesterase
MRPTLRKAVWVIGALVAVSCAGALAFTVWASDAAQPQAAALAALTSDSEVEVRLTPWITFFPAEPKSTGLILYPGGRVDPRAYAASARDLAEAGYLTVIVPMPLNLAVLAPDRALEVMQAYPEIERWVVGGHSLGGAMAANFAAQHPDRTDGLVLWAAYPAGGDDLAASGLPVASISGSLDGLSDPASILASRALLPPDAAFIEIVGGNHAQFGDYGPQTGDNPAAASPEAQRDQVVRATLALLQRIER